MVENGCFYLGNVIGKGAIMDTSKVGGSNCDPLLGTIPIRGSEMDPK